VRSIEDSGDGLPAARRAVWLGAQMTSLSRRSVWFVGLFGFSLAMSGAFWWSGAGWAQTSPHPTPGMQCMTPNPDCIAKAAPYCAQKVGASNSFYSSCVREQEHLCQVVWVKCP
jgi:hypothetical protein